MPLIAEEVLLRVRAGWQGEEVSRGLSRLQQQVAAMGRTVQSALNLLLPASGVGVVAGIALATRQAVQLSAQFEKIRTGIAAILGSYGDVVDAQGRVLKGAERFNELLRISRGLMTDIRREADRTILETRELMEYVQTGLGYGMARGLTPQQLVPVISRIAVAGRVMGLPQGYPIVSEIRALLTGENLRMSQVAQAVGIRAQDLQGLRGEAFIRYMDERLAGFVAASDAFAQSFEARWSTFISKIQEILIEVGEAILPVLSSFAERATVALQQWRASGGVAQLQQVMSAIISAITTIGGWILQLTQWIQTNPTLASALGWTLTGAAIGGKAGGLPGAGIGALAGGSVWLGRELFAAWQSQYGRDLHEQRLEQLLGRATGISAPGGRRVAPTALPTAGVPTFRPRPVRVPALGDTAAQRRRQAVERRVRTETADLAVARAEQALDEALRDAEEWGYAPQAIERVRLALQRWEQARLERAKAAVHGEDARLASVLMAQARIEIAERKQRVLDQLEQGRQRALAEDRREAARWLERRWETEQRIEEARQRRIGEQARLLFGGIAQVARGISERVERFAGAMQTWAEMERRRRAYAVRFTEEVAEQGLPWTTFGVPALAAGMIRPALRMMPMGALAVAASDAMAQAIEDWRERQRRFWTGLRDFIVDSLHDAFVTAGMRLSENLRSWREAFADMFRTLKQMLMRAILEVVYDRVIRAAVEAFADWLADRLGRGAGGQKKIGASVGASAGAAIGAAYGPVGAVVGGLIGGWIGGMFQHGGTAVPRRAYVVGERGPELFVPGTVGTVLSAQAFQQALSRLTESRRSAAVNVFVNHATEADLARRIGREVAHTLRGHW